MKKVWSAPDVQELTIQATTCNDGWYGSGWGSRPSRPGYGGRPNRPGYGGGCGGDEMSPDWKHPEDETSSC